MKLKLLDGPSDAQLLCSIEIIRYIVEKRNLAETYRFVNVSFVNVHRQISAAFLTEIAAAASITEFILKEIMVSCHFVDSQFVK